MARQAHYVLSTHWDREWYQPFQDYRYRLVQLLDRVLAGWQREELNGPFQTDGQAILLEDYLEVRPERREQVLQRVKEGRFVVGPWYVLPDEFLVSGEALVRNLRMGRAAARAMGGLPSTAGFLCDMFGHNSQMPQIFAGFGIRGGFLWRGTNLIDQRLFRWRGADGTEIPCYRFGPVGYCSYAAQVRAANSVNNRPAAGEIEQRIRAFLAEEDEKTRVGPLLLFDGGDHMEWDPVAYAVLARHFAGQPEDERWQDFEIVHSSLDGYLDELLTTDETIPVERVGELREPGLHPDQTDAQWLIPGVTSSRVRIKQANARCQSLLTQWAEPVNAFASQALGLPFPQGYLDVAWRWLIQNHPHDSICGCSIDAVHEDMFYRFHQCEQIGERITVEAMRRISASVQGEPGENELRVSVFNPLARPFEGAADLELELPAGWPGYHETMGDFEHLPAFRIYAADGQEIHYQRTAQALNRTRFRTYDSSFPTNHRVNRVCVSLRLRIPALGYTTLILRAAERGESVRHPQPKGLATSERSMENEHLAVIFETNGSLTLHDKRSGKAYPRLLTFEDSADIGDGWNYGPAINDQVFYSTTCRSSLALVADGPYRCTFRVRTVLEVPEAFQFASMTRSERLRGLVIDSLVTLRAGADRVEVETTVRNDVLDHRLRVLFPSQAHAKTCLMDTPFDVVERQVALREDNARYREMEVEHRPQQTFTAVFDDRRGLAIVSTGLMEAAVLDLPERPIALTLFRAIRKTVNTDGEPGGQVQGELSFRYWMVPLDGAPDRAHLFDLGQLLSGGLRPVFLEAEDVARFRQARSLPVEAGLLRVEGPVVLTSLLQQGEGLEARLFNPNTGEVEAVLDLTGWPRGADLPRQAQPVDFESSPVGHPYPLEAGRVTVPFGPKQIRTLRFCA